MLKQNSALTKIKYISYYCFVKNEFDIILKNPLPIKYTFANVFSNPRNSPNSPFPVKPSSFFSWWNCS